METIMKIITDNWVWLGPVLVAVLAGCLVWVIMDLFFGG